MSLSVARRGRMGSLWGNRFGCRSTEAVADSHVERAPIGVVTKDKRPADRAAGLKANFSCGCRARYASSPSRPLLAAYLTALSMIAHACGTPFSTVLLPGITAQPPFSTKLACCHELAFFSSTRLDAASALR
jgi:hypothetical protein